MGLIRAEETMSLEMTKDIVGGPGWYVLFSSLDLQSFRERN